MLNNTKTSVLLALAIFAMTFCGSVAHAQQRWVFERGDSGLVTKDANRITVELQKVDVAPLSSYASEKPSTGGSRVIVYFDTQNAKGDASLGAEYALFLYRDNWTLRRREAGMYSAEVGAGSIEQTETGARQDITISFESSLIQGEITRCWNTYHSTNPRIATTPVSLVEEARALLGKGGYDKIIALLSPVIEKSRDEEKPEKLDQNLLYARGFAAWRTGYYAMAEQDFSAIGDFAPDFAAKSIYEPASEFVQRIRAMKALAPPLVHDIKEGETVIFRVYYTQDDEWTAAIVDMLPIAYAVNRKMLGKDTLESSVFIFSNYDKFAEFYKLRGSGRPPGSWVWAAGGIGAFYFCNDSARTNPKARDINSDYFQTVVIHEYNHCIVQRVTGDAPMPRWLTEGLASIAEGKFSTSHVRNYANYMRRALAANAVLSLEDLSHDKDFVAHQEEALKKRLEQETPAEPYVQSYWMTSYFLTLLPEQGLEPFLLDVRNQRSFKKVLKKHTGLTEEEFHEQWLQQLPKSIR